MLIKAPECDFKFCNEEQRRKRVVMRKSICVDGKSSFFLLLAFGQATSKTMLGQEKRHGVNGKNEMDDSKKKKKEK